MRKGSNQMFVAFLLLATTFAFNEKPYQNLEYIEPFEISQSLNLNTLKTNPFLFEASTHKIPSQFSINVFIDNQDFNLTLNRIEHPHVEVHVIGKSNSVQKFENLSYMATVNSDPEELGRFLVEQAGNDILVQGVFTWKGSTFNIKTIASYKALRRADDADIDNDINEAMMVGYRSEPSEIQTHKCSHDHLDYNTNRASSDFELLSNTSASGMLFSRAPAGCPTSKKVLYIGVAADCTYFQAMGSDPIKVQKTILETFNIVSGIYEKHFNIQIGVVTIKIMSECSTSTDPDTPWNVPCSSTFKIDDRLNAFSKWRWTQSVDAGLWHLMTNCPSGGVVGVAWLNQVCQVQAFQPTGSKEWVSGTGVSALTSNSYAVVAHEIGHNFGAVHDCDSGSCQSCTSKSCSCCQCDGCDCEGQYLMNPEGGGLPKSEFSPCSQKEICKKLAVFGRCLAVPGTLSTINGNECGNGIKEDGEECDCGKNCATDPCCGTDCKLKGNAQCSELNGPCCSNCLLVKKEDNKICRPAQDSCQKDAVCSGTEEACPETKVLADGSTCEFADSKCASGICTSRDRQCILVGQRSLVTGACPSSDSCDMVCKLGSSCVYLDASFIDGTPCGSNGKCSKGACKGASILSAAAQWAKQNSTAFIVIGSILGIVILVFLVKCCCCGVKRKRRVPPILVR